MENIEKYNVKIYYYENETQYRIYEKPIAKKKKLAEYDDTELPKAKKIKKKKTKPTYIPFLDEVIEAEELDENYNFERSLQVALNRSKQNLIGILRANVWDYFITFTFNPRKVNSDNYEEVCLKAGKYMHNLRQNYCPDLKYVLVPELHKNGEHYHLHGVIGNADGLKLRVSGKYDKHGRIIYNIPSWEYGWNTATEVEHTGKVSNYISKYITKDTENLLHGKRRYWASHNCILREEVCEELLVDNHMDMIRFLSKNDSIKHMKSAYVPQTGNNIYYIET